MALNSNVFRAGDRLPMDWRSESMATYTQHDPAAITLANSFGAGGAPRDIPDYKGAAEYMTRNFVKLGTESRETGPSTHRDTFPRYSSQQYRDREPPCDPSAAAAGSPSRGTTRVVMDDGSVKEVTRVASGLDLGHDGSSISFETTTRAASSSMVRAQAQLIAAGGSARPSGDEGQAAARLAKEDHLNQWKLDNPDVRLLSCAAGPALRQGARARGSVVTT